MSTKTAKTLKLATNYRGEKKALDVAPMMVRAPLPPEGMNAIAQEFWRKKVIHLKQIGRLHAIDLDALECISNLYSDVKKTRKSMDASLSDEVFSKHQRKHNEAVKLFMAAAKEFGFTPASRGKIKAILKEDGDSDFDKI